MAAGRTSAHRRFSLTPYLFILPHLIFFLVFLAYPFFRGIYLSLFNYDPNLPDFKPFVGLENYRNLFTRGSLQFDDFWRAMRNTLVFVAYSVPPLVFLALVLAVLLNGKYRGRNLFRGIYFAPFALSAVVASLLWWWIFQDQGGLINAYLTQLRLSPVAWLGDVPPAWIAITVCTVWWTVGFNTVIFLAALQDIPESIYEAAAIDGANPLQQFFGITVPLLRPVITFIVTITLIASMNLFAQPYVMTRGGPPPGATEPIIMRIYTEGVTQSRMGSAAAMSVFVAAILVVLTILNFRFFGRSEEQ